LTLAKSWFLTSRGQFFGSLLCAYAHYEGDRDKCQDVILDIIIMLNLESVFSNIPPGYELSGNIFPLQQYSIASS
jgi:hypothetical protein